jgi:hypothetical protein
VQKEEFVQPLRSSMHPASTPGRRDLPLRIAQTPTAALGSRFRLPIPGQQVGDFVGGIVGEPGQHVCNSISECRNRIKMAEAVETTLYAVC